MIILSCLQARMNVKHERIKHSHEHTHTPACMHSGSLSCRTRESCNVAEGYERFQPKDFLVSFWSLYLTKERDNNNNNNKNNSISYIKRITTTAKTLQLLKHHIIISKFLSSNTAITIPTTNSDNNNINTVTITVRASLTWLRLVVHVGMYESSLEDFVLMVIIL